MKKFLHLVTFILILVCNFGYSQLSCGDTFTDSGGELGNYQDNENITTTICPTTSTGIVSVSFASFSLENNYDFLTIYDGNTQIGSYTNTNSPGIVTSTIAGGCLTFVFTSDGSIVRAGWVANVTCLPTPTCLNPTGLAASNIGTNSMTLNWNPNSSATVFHVLALPCGSPAPNASTTGYTIATTNINYLLTNLQPETCYDVYVRNQCSTTDFSSWRVLNNLITPPTCPRPTNLFSSNITATSATLSWSNNSTATNFNVLALPCNSPLPTETSTGWIATTSNPHVFTNLNPNTCYTFYVRAACSETDISAWSNGTSLTTQNAPPSCGGIFTDSGGIDGTYLDNENITTSICADNPLNLVSVSFTSFNTEAGFDFLNVYQGTTLLGTFAGTNSPGTITSTIPGSCLTFVFTSDGSVVRPGWIANVTCFPPPTCLKPTAVVTSGTTTNSTTLTFTNNSTATNFNVLALPCNSPLPNATTTGWIATTLNPHIFTDLNPNTCYTFYVRAVCDETDLSEWSVGVNATTLNIPPACGGTFTDPGGLANYADNLDSTVTICPDVVGNVVTVTFSAFDTEATWDGLYVFDGNSTSSPQIASTNPGGNVPGGLAGSYWGTTIPEPFTSTSPDGCLTFRFISDNVITRAGWVATVMCEPPPTCPKPTNLIATDTTFNSSTLTWMSSVGTTFNVLALPCGSPIPNATTTGWITTTSNPYFLTNLNPDTCYTIYVRAVCSETDSSYWSTGLSILTQTVPPACGGTFTDIAGANLNYANNSDSTVTICPTVLGELVTVSFTQFNTQDGSDGLYVFDGSSINSQQIASTNAAGNVPGGLAGSYWGTAIPGPFTSSSPDGCLTFRFRSDNFTTASGWVANVTCSPGPDRLYLVAFIDSNNNGIKEPNETIFQHGTYVTQMNNSGNDTYVSSSLGTHSIFDTNPSNTYDASFVINPEYAAYFTAVPTNYNDLNIPFGAGTNILHFPVTIAQAYTDVAVAIIPISQPRAGFTYLNRIVYRNQGVASASGTLTYTKDDLVTITAIGQPGVVVTATGFTYNFTNLLPNESRIINVTMSVPNIPTVNIGDILTNSTLITATSDIDTNNNTFSNSQVVIAAYDPNDKMESRGEQILISDFTTDDYLYYTIRFENTGTAEARSINVNDLLDSQLDENSIRMVSASHPYVLNRNGNNLNWYFENINLPVSVPNTLIGKGYVMFKVKPVAGFAVGTIIPNNADIYFESNPAITTNTFNTEFVSTLANINFDNSNLVLFPNPTSNSIQINLQNTNEIVDTIQITDIIGKNISKINNISSNQINVDVSHLSQGVYFVEITTQNNMKLIKKLIKE